MAVEYNSYRNNAVVPKLPRFNMPYTYQQNTDPSAYYTKALGFLPIDTRYMVNTTNNLAYNSMADVLFNKAAQEERWADTPWMQGVLNLLRIIADTGLLMKDTVIDPIVQGAIDDGWSGLMRGGSTALMNTLVNLGNTLDIVSNPIKGLVLEGGEGFVKGLVGDENGRKQYDYNEYIDTGNGVADFVLSLAAEIVSDPLNWISFGGKTAVKTGADAAADTVLKSVKSGFEELIEAALENGFKSTDEFLTAYKAGLIDIPDSLSWLKGTTGSLLEQSIGNADVVTKATVSQLDDLQPLLKKAITTAETTGDYTKLANSFAQGKGTRFKVTGNTPAAQMFVSDYLKAASTTMPDLMGSNISNAVKYGAKTYKGVQNVEKVLRQTAGMTGLTPAVYLTGQGARAAGWIRNVTALKDEGVIKTLEELEKKLDVQKVDKVIKVLEDATPPELSKELITKAYELKDAFNFKLNSSTFSKTSIAQLQSRQRALVSELNKFTKKLNIKDVATFSDYIKYLEDKAIVLKNTDDFAEVSEFIKEIQSINKILTEDFSDANVVAHYKKSVDALRFKNRQAARTQQQQMDQFNKDQGKWRRKYSNIVPELEKHGVDVSDALDKLTKVNPDTGKDVLDYLRNDIIPRVQTALIKSKQHTDVVESFVSMADMFKTSLDAYLESPTDLIARSNLIKSYQDLAAELTRYSNWKLPDEGVTASNATEIFNMLGAPYRERSKDWGTIDQSLTPLDEATLDAERYYLNDIFQKNPTIKLDGDPITIIDASSRTETISGAVNYKTLKKFYDFFDAKDVLTTTESAQFKRISNAINEMLVSEYGADVIDIFQKAKNLKSLLKQGAFSSKVDDVIQLTKAVKDLPELSVKPLDHIIDPADVSKYKLIIYTVMNRMSSFANRMLGLDETGETVSRTLDSIKVTSKFTDAAYSNDQIGSFLKYAKEKGLLPEVYNVAPGADTTINLVVAVKHAARQYLGVNSLHSEAGDWLSNYYWMDLESFARSNPKFNAAWKEYNDILTDINVARLDAVDTIDLQHRLNTAVFYLRDVLEEQSKNVPQMGFVRNVDADPLIIQAENILKMYDEDIIALAKFDTQSIYNYPEAHLSKLISEYDNHNSDLYKFLNSSEFSADSFEGGVINSTKILIERLRAYKNLVLEISDLAKANGLEGFYTEGLLDAFMTQLTKHPVVTTFNIPKIVNDMMSGTDLFVRNMYDAPSTAMDNLLGQVVKIFTENPVLEEDALFRLSRLTTNLQSGLAHSAVTDVDNLIDLMWLSKYTDDARIKDMFTAFENTAAGKRVVVFDIESTGATEAAAHVFQIAGKVLDEHGTEVPGSQFNFIIKPPAGIKPTPTVLKTLAPAGVDPEKWWIDNIVKAETIDGVQDVYDNIEDALEAFVKRCADQGKVVLMGHNIKSYDLPTLMKRSSTAKKYLAKAYEDAFDTLRDMEHNIMFQLTDAQQSAFKKQLEAIFNKALINNNPALGKRPFTYTDVTTLSDLKQILKDKSPEFSQKEKKSFKKKGFGDSNAVFREEIDDLEQRYGTGMYSNQVDDSTQGYRIDLDSMPESPTYAIEDVLDNVLHEWRSPSKMNTGSNKYFIVSKLNPDSVEKQIQDYLKELADSGLINVMPGKNIMQYFSGGVSKGNIIINPVRVISYEVEDIFDLNKALKEYAVQNIEPGKTIKSYKTIIDTKTGKVDSVPEYFTSTNALRIQDLSRLTKQAVQIQRIRNWLPKYYIDTVVDNARSFLKEAAAEQTFIKLLYDEADDITVVAAAIYAYRHLNTTSSLKADAVYGQFDMQHVIDSISVLSQKRFDARVLDAAINQQKHYTPILHRLDDDGIPQALFEENWQTLEEFVGVIEKDMGLDGITQFNVGHNLYNLHSAAKHELLGPVAKIAKKVESYLESLGSGRKATEQSLKQYHSILDTLAVKEILDRADRINALASEMYARGGYVVFETTSKVDLSDFKADIRFVTVDNILNTDGKYIQVIAVTRDTFKNTADINLAPVVVKNINGVDNVLIDSVDEIRTYLSDKVVKNLGHSHGDTISTDVIDSIREMLSRVGVSEDVLNKLVTTEDLIESKYFSTVRANNSIVGGTALWKYVTNDAEAFCISDPFKQALYSIKYTNAARTDLIHYCSLLLNDWSNIASDTFSKLSDADLYKLLKDNDDFVMVYMTKTGYWNNTKSGLIVKEFDLVNAASINRARKMGGVHIMPRTQAAQLMKAVNEFELPPIAKLAKGISDVYKVAYLGSLGFIIRNVIDSNYKTYASLDGQVSLGKSVNHFFQTIGIVRKHTNVGQEYSKAMGKYFRSDLEYEVFYKYCNGVEDIVSAYPEKLQSRITRQLNELSEKFDNTLITKVKADLIEPELFSVVDAFINHGPSAGLSRTILDNIPSASKGFDNIGALDSFNKWITQDTPARFVYGANDYIEQAARLSMFLQRLELGDTIDDANKAIIKAHFDYSDKSIGMIYTEILFPFMSFSYKNLNFWVEMMYSNPMLVGQMENIFRPIFDYQGLFEPDQGAYQAYDYTFDWSKDVTSFEANAPWTMINAARLYHILNGNILIKTGEVKHDAGYGAKDNDLYTVFKLSPSVLDATKMLFNPLGTYSDRLLPPGESLKNATLNVLNGKAPIDQISITSLANMLPYFDTMLQRVGRDENHKLRHNNLYQRIEDAGLLQALPSIFGAAYVPQKDNVYYYDSDYNILGGFKQNYYAKRNYSNPYNSKYPSYTLTRMAQNNKPRNIYAKSKTYSVYNNQYNYYRQNAVDRILRHRVKDYYHYY